MAHRGCFQGTPANRVVRVIAHVSVVIVGEAHQPINVEFGRHPRLSAGVEVGGVSVYLSEIATPGNWGFYVAWQSASQQMAVVFAALIGLVLNALMPVEAISAWGWRIPFFVGSALIPFLFVIRRLLQETAEFEARKDRPTAGTCSAASGAIHVPAEARQDDA